MTDVGVLACSSSTPKCTAQVGGMEVGLEYTPRECGSHIKLYSWTTRISRSVCDRNAPVPADVPPLFFCLQNYLHPLYPQTGITPNCRCMSILDFRCVYNLLSEKLCTALYLQTCVHSTAGVCSVVISDVCTSWCLQNYVLDIGNTYLHLWTVYTRVSRPLYLQIYNRSKYT